MSHALLHGGHYLAVVAACLAAVRPPAPDGPGGRRGSRSPLGGFVVPGAAALGFRWE